MNVEYIRNNFYGYFNGSEVLYVFREVKEDDPRKLAEQLITKLSVDDVLKISKTKKLYIHCGTDFDKESESKEVEKILNEISGSVRLQN